MIKVEVFRAGSNLLESKEFIIGHRKVLQVFDIANITSANLDWAFSDSSIIISIKKASNDKLIGGARLQIADDKLSLPIEDAVGEIDHGIFDFIKAYMPNGVAEVCGLWNTREAAKIGIGSYFMTRVALAISTQLDIRSLVMLCAPSTVQMATDMGSRIVSELGDKGKFYYPKLDLIATSMIMEDIYNLDSVAESEIDHILEMREKQIFSGVYVGRRGLSVNVDYNLKVK